MTPDELAEIVVRVGATTDGLWTVEAMPGAEGLRDGWWQDEGRTHNVVTHLDFITSDGDGMGSCSEADATFIAHAHEDVPALVAEVRRLRARVDELEQAPTTAEWAVPQPLEAGDQTLGTAPPWLTDIKRATPLLRQQIETAVPSYRVVAHPETMQLDPPLTIEAGEIALWATDGSKVGRYRKNDAGEWRLIEQREVQP